MAVLQAPGPVGRLDTADTTPHKLWLGAAGASTKCVDPSKARGRQTHCITICRQACKGSVLESILMVPPLQAEVPIRWQAARQQAGQQGRQAGRQAALKYLMKRPHSTGKRIKGAQHSHGCLRRRTHSSSRAPATFDMYTQHRDRKWRPAAELKQLEARTAFGESQEWGYVGT